MLNKSLLSSVVSHLLSKPEKVESFESVNEMVLGDKTPIGFRVDLDSLIGRNFVHLENDND